ncbi:ABC transporter ATP-binding protein/permease [Myxococcota bacterium]|nr:ABC transporter ATP-binding protein/permease [Myxococcota bacterium]
MPRILRNATDAIVARDGTALFDAALTLVLVAVVGATVRIFSRILIFNSGRKVEFDMRNELFEQLEKLPPSFYGKMPLAQVMSRLVNDLTQVRLLLGPGMLNVTNTALVYAVALPLLFSMDAELATYSLAGLPVLVLLGRAFARRMYERSLEAQERLGVLSAKVQENLSGVMTVRAFQREKDEQALFAALNDRYLETNMALARIRGTMFPMMGLAGAVGSVIVLWLGGHHIIDGRMTVGMFVEFNAYLAALSWPTIALGWMISIWQRGLASMKRVNEIFAAQPTIVGGATDAPEGPGRLEVKGLSFTYPDAKRPALDGVTFTARPGATIVVVGRTGSGKSTLLKALARLLEVPRGTIFLDGVDVLELPLGAVRGALSYAPQDAFLFSRTIFENIAFGKPHASDAEVERAMRAANLHGDVAGFPEGLDTLVGERGITLSGGQRQRAALARALILDPKILLLDDSLAAVDTETETRIVEALAARGHGRTTILVTHRFAFASEADVILVLDHGKVVEQGTEAELLAKGGVYAEMHKRQRIREALAHEGHPHAEEVRA